MAENFQDNVKYAGSTLGVSGDAVAVGSTNAGAKSVIFATSGTQGHLAWLPTANRTINLPDAGGTVLLSSQGILSLSAGAAQITSGQVIFSNSNGLAFGANGQTVTGSYTMSTAPGAIAGGTQTATSGTIVFSDSNGISFGLSGSTRMTASYTVPTVPAQLSVGNSNIGNTVGDTGVFTGRVVFAGGNNVTLSGSSNGGSATFTISGPNTVAQSNQTVGLYALGNTTQNSSTTLDARTLSFNALGAATMGYSNGSIQVSVPTQTAQTQSNIQAVYDGANSISTGTIRFTNANGVSFSVNGQTISGSVAAQTNQTVGFYAVSNTTQNSSTTLDARTVSFQGAGIASVGYSNGSIVISVPSGGGAGDGVNIIAAGTQTAATTGSVLFQNSNGVTFGMSNSSVVTASVSYQTEGWYALNNTTGASTSSTFDGRTISVDARGALSAGFTNGSIQLSVPATSSLSGVGGISISTNGSTISISGPKFTNYEPNVLLHSGSTTYAPSIGSWYFEPLTLPANISGGRINRLISFANSASMIRFTTAASYGSNTTGGRSQEAAYSNSVAIYSLGVGTNSTRLETMWSNTFTYNVRISVSVATGAGTTVSVSNGITLSYITNIDASGSYTTTTLSSSTSQSSAANSIDTTALTAGYSSFLNILTGQIVLPLGFNTTLAPGNYWLAQAWSSANTTTNTTGSATASGNLLSVINQAAIFGASALSHRLWPATVSTSGAQHYPGRGTWSVASAAPATSIAFSDIRFATNSVGLIQYFNFVNSNIT